MKNEIFDREVFHLKKHGPRTEVSVHKNKVFHLKKHGPRTEVSVHKNKLRYDKLSAGGSSSAIKLEIS